MKVIELHKKQMEWWKKKLGIDDYSVAWIAFIKGLLIGSLIRNAGGYVWAFNTKIFFENRRNQGHLKQAVFMGWIPLICGSLGSVFGGYISDKYIK